MARRFDTCFRNIRLFQVTVDFPNVNSNGTVSADVATITTFPANSIILCWGFDTDASDIDDLQLQFKIITANTLRYTLVNPTGGAIDPGSITMTFVVGEPNADLYEVL